MTERLYDADPYCTRFRARLIETQTLGNRLAVVLDRTAFYPTGGGQPHDTGTLAGHPVLEVVERADGTVVHMLPADSTLPEGELEGVVDWPRRFDHMQQHTGQHILSQAFAQLFQADTVGFHLSQSYSTIDLNRNDLGEEEIASGEMLANQIVFEDRPVSWRWVDTAEARQLPLRKPPTVHDHIRVVHIEGFDWSACGGTHVARTGAVGLIKVTHTERRGAETRLTFLCGGRALRHYAALHTLTSRMARQLTVAVDELPGVVQRLQDEARRERKAREQLQEKLVEYEAATLACQAPQMGTVRVIVQPFIGRVLQEVRQLASRITAQPGNVVLFGLAPGGTEGATGQGKGQLLFARSEDVAGDMRALLQEVCRAVGGSGGGSPTMAQGGCDAARLAEALERAQTLLRRWLAN
ncbi:MAG: DHHA1 domain-containing protein [Anaerolineae bacterium]|nr:DHHA1 domain-containing protein [Anaerolineae bacterium]MDW8071175.1 DHHA1 domain-containing protein [Anaerolineae bacterium]